MSASTLQIPVDAQTAQVYAALPDIQRKQVPALLSFLLKELQAQPLPLEDAIERMQTEAAANGLTPGALEDLLREN